MMPVISTIVLALIGLWVLMRMAREPAAHRALRIMLLLLSLAALQAGLYPPTMDRPAPALQVLTAGADPMLPDSAAGPVVGIPVAPERSGARSYPDLASALRNHAGVASVRVFGHGLDAADREAAAGLPVSFAPAPLPAGLVELDAPARANAGSQLQLAGRINGPQGSLVELLDPAGQPLAQARTDLDGRFVLRADAGPPGRHLLQLRVPGEEEKARATVTVPLAVAPASPLKLMVLAAAPGPELKYLRRWALDAGLELSMRTDLRPDLRLVRAAADLSAASLDDTDVLILDERSLETMTDADREAIHAAVNRGLGLMLRITGPLSANARRFVQRSGFEVHDADLARSIRLPPTSMDSPQGEGHASGVAPPALNRRPLSVEASDARTLLRTESGDALGLWRATGRGRIGLWWLSDSFRLVLAGHAPVHARLWAESLETLARPRADAPIDIPGQRAQLNERVEACVLQPGSELIGPDGVQQPVLPDVHGCAAFWPTQAGWHRITSASQSADVFVHDDTASPALSAGARQAATRMLARTSPAPAPGASYRAALPSWPFLLVWLLASALLWWLERRSAPG